MKITNEIIKYLILVFQIVIITIPAFAKFHKNETIKFKNLTTAGKWFFGLSLATIILSLFSTYFSETINKNDSENQRIANDKRVDRLIEKYSGKVDSSYINTTKTFIDVTAQYGLHYDSINKRLENKIDTSKKEPIPLISLSEIKHDSTKNNNDYFSLKLSCRNAPANNLKIKYYFFSTDEYWNLKYVYKTRAFPLDQTFSKDNDFNINLRLLKPQKTRYLLILVKGTYSTLNLKNTFALSDIYYYDFNKTDNIQLNIPLIDEIRSMALDYLKKNNIN